MCASEFCFEVQCSAFQGLLYHSVILCLAPAAMHTTTQVMSCLHAILVGLRNSQSTLSTRVSSASLFVSKQAHVVELVNMVVPIAAVVQAVVHSLALCMLSLTALIHKMHHLFPH